MDSAIAHYLTQDPDRMADLKKGRIVEVMGRHYAVCTKCDYIVRVDKPLFGSVHFCTGEEDNV